ncbi:MAG: hypothetical protein AAGK05_16845, partial [Pseudomonadota bacterium]
MKAADLLSTYAETENLSEDIVKKISFLCEQIHLVHNPPGRHNKFTNELLTVAILWKAHSTSCYKAILNENVLTLPSLRTLRRIAQSFSVLENDTMKYLKLRSENLNVYEKTVILLFDEIYVHQTIENDNGKFVGLANNDKLPATTILCFMIKSLASKYADIIAAIPVHGLTVTCLRTNLLKVLHVVLLSGFNVVALCSDNHPVNRSLYKSLSDGETDFSCKNPYEQEKKLYLLIDPTHTIKNIYNNFQKRINFHFPSELPCTSANFNNIKSLHELESTMSFRMAHKLTRITLNLTYP